MRFLLTLAVVLLQILPAFAQEARRRWEMQRQIRLDKFEQVLPRAMRDNGIDMWIVAVKENHYDPLWNDLGRGYVSGIGYYVFTDRGGDRIERAALGPSGYLLERVGRLRHHRRRRRRSPSTSRRAIPKRIGAQHVRRDRPRRRPVGDDARAPEEDARRAVRVAASCRREKLVADFRSHRVAAEIVAFGEAADIAIQLTERALSNEVITPGKTTLEDVAWWMQDRLLDRALGSEFDMPSVYVTGPNGIVATSNSRIIQPGDVMMIDWGVQLMNFGTDVKRVAYVLKPGETAPPKSIQNAFDKALAVRDVVKKAIKVGVRADETMKNDGRGAARRRLRRDRVQPPEQGRQDRRRLRLPSGRQHRPRHRPVADHLAAAADDVRRCTRSTCSRSNTSPTRRSPSGAARNCGFRSKTMRS